MASVKLGRGLRRFGVLLGSASLLTLATVIAAQAQVDMMPGDSSNDSDIETVLVTGSIIHGGVNVGVPPTTVSAEDFTQAGAVTIADALQNIPAVVMISDTNVVAGGGYVARDQNINIRNLSLHGDRTLIMVDGIGFPNQGAGGCQTDPSIIPQLAVDHIDVLTDGASATYGSSAIAGVVNVTLKRGFDGLRLQAQYNQSLDVGGPRQTLSALYGKTWDGGDITLSVNHYDTSHIDGAPKPFWTYDFTPYGFDDHQNLVDSRPGIIAYTPGVGAAAPNIVATAPANTPAGFTALLGKTCANCYSIPTGQKGVGLTFASILANKGEQNEINSYTDAWESPILRSNQATLTFDQRLMDNVSLFGDAWDLVRTSFNHNSPGGNSFTMSVPKSNPYFPTGAPSNLNSLNVYEDLENQVPILVHTTETAGRIDGGLNLILPHEWIGKVYGAVSKISNYTLTQGTINNNNLSAALGNTVPAVAQVNGSSFPGVPAFTKPTNIPYFNPFCDSVAFSTCNDPATLAYISGYSKQMEGEVQNEYGAHFDGPIWTLPAGELKGAVGTSYQNLTYQNNTVATNTSNAALFTYTTTSSRRNVLAFFGELSVPVFSPQYSLPLVKQLDVSADLRYDMYDQFGDALTPKVSFDWTVAWGLKFLGSWGTSFRAPSPQENTAAGPSLSNIAANPGAITTNTIGVCSTLNVAANPGTIAAIINPTCSAALNFPGILQAGTGPSQAPIEPGGVVQELHPEKGKNVTLGFDFAPTENSGPMSFLAGLDVNMSYWFIRVTQAIQGEFRLAGFNTGALNNPAYTSAFLVPQTDPNFLAQATAILANNISTQPVTSASLVSVIADTGTKNIGNQSLNGVDFNISYLWDMGAWNGVNLGAWNTGVTGTYNISNKSQDNSFSPVISNFAVNADSHLSKVRAHLGWTQQADKGSGFNAIGFMNYIGHFGPTTNPLPPQCFQLGNATCASFGSAFSAFTSQQNLSVNVASVTSFDFGIGYSTGELPSEDIYKGLRLQLTVNNVLDTPPPFEYEIQPPGGAKPHAFYTSTASDELGPNGRSISFVITKDF